MTQTCSVFINTERFPWLSLLTLADKVLLKQTLTCRLCLSGHGTEEERKLFLPGRLRPLPLWPSLTSCDAPEAAGGVQSESSLDIYHKYNRAAFNIQQICLNHKKEKPHQPLCTGLRSAASNVVNRWKKKCIAFCVSQPKHTGLRSQASDIVEHSAAYFNTHAFTTNDNKLMLSDPTADPLFIYQNRFSIS